MKIVDDEKVSGPNIGDSRCDSSLGAQEYTKLVLRRK